MFWLWLIAAFAVGMAIGVLSGYFIGRSFAIAVSEDDPDDRDWKWPSDKCKDAK